MLNFIESQIATVHPHDEKRGEPNIFVNRPNEVQRYMQILV